MGCPVCYQLLTAKEALATEAAVQGLVDSGNEDVLLLGELAHMTGLCHLTINFHYRRFFMGDVVVRRQRAKSLEFRGSKEGVAHILQRAFPTSMNTHDPQSLIITCQAGGL